MKTELNKQLSKLNSDLMFLKLQVANGQREGHLIRAEIKKVKELILDESKDERDIRVSDHAVIRYLERHGGMDIETIKKQIATDQLIELVSKMGGNGKYPIDDKQSVIMKDYVIVTLIN